MAARSARIDALRGLAVFGILLVNVWGFVYGNLAHRFPPMGLDASLVDQWTVFVVAAFANQKFYPIFAFLFGAGFAFQTGGRRPPGPRLDAVRATYLRRLRWLLVCGIVHGTLFWFGDILTAYALLGYWLVQYAGRRLSELRRTLWRLVAANVIMSLVIGGMIILFDQAPLDVVIATIQEGEHLHAIFTQGGWWDITEARVLEYGSVLLELIFILPRLALLFMLGVFAARAGYLTRPQRHKAFWGATLLLAATFALPLNIWAGLVAVATAMEPTNLPPYAGLATALVEVAGPVLGAGYVALFMLARCTLLPWLVPVGRMALTNYLTHSVLLTLLLQGAWLGWGAHIAHGGLMLLAAAIMLGQMLFSHWWMARHALGPMEWLWRRYTHHSART